MTYHNVLSAARELPLADQVELAQALLGNIKSSMRDSDRPSSEPELSPLDGMSQHELMALADAVVAPQRQTQMRSLLDTNREQMLSPDEETEIDSLLDEIDQVALLKARAQYTLALQQSIGTDS